MMLEHMGSEMCLTRFARQKRKSSFGGCVRQFSRSRPWSLGNEARMERAGSHHKVSMCGICTASPGPGMS